MLIIIVWTIYLQVDPTNGHYNGSFKTYAICGAIRTMVSRNRIIWACQILFESGWHAPILWLGVTVNIFRMTWNISVLLTGLMVELNKRQLLSELRLSMEAVHNPIISSVKDKTALKLTRSPGALFKIKATARANDKMALNQSKLICFPVHSSTSRAPSIILHFQYGTSNRWTDSVQASPEKLPWWHQMKCLKCNCTIHGRHHLREIVLSKTILGVLIPLCCYLAVWMLKDCYKIVFLFELFILRGSRMIASTD